MRACPYDSSMKFTPDSVGGTGCDEDSGFGHSPDLASPFLEGSLPYPAFRGS